MADLNNKENVDYNYAASDVAKLSKDLICTVCQNPLQNPVMHISCENMFCAVCISQVQQCPLCKGGFGAKKTDLTSKIPRAVTNQLNDLPVACPRCTVTVARSTLAEHVGKCAVDCALGCGEKVLQHELVEHNARHCKAVIVQCGASESLSCSWTGPRSQKRAHETSCPLHRVSLFIAPILDRLDDLEKDNAALKEEIKGIHLRCHQRRNLTD